MLGRNRVIACNEVRATLVRTTCELLLVVAAFISSGSPAHAEDPPQFLLQWGGPNGNALPGTFHIPRDIAVDSEGNVFVSDAGNNRVQVFSNDGVFIRQIGGPGTAPGRFNGVGGVAVFGGVLYASDGRIQRFTLDGSLLGWWGSLGTGPGQFNGPAGIAVDRHGNLYVVDSANRRVQKFTGDGAFILSWPTDGTCVGIAISQSDEVFVVDGNADRVIRFTTQGVPIGEIGGLDGPYGVACEPGGAIYVSDSYNHRVVKMSPNGSVLSSWGTHGSGGFGQFNFPEGVAVDPFGNVFVVDQGHDLVQKFGWLPVPAKSASWGRIKTLYR